MFGATLGCLFRCHQLCCFYFICCCFLLFVWLPLNSIVIFPSLFRALWHLFFSLSTPLVVVSLLLSLGTRLPLTTITSFGLGWPFGLRKMPEYMCVCKYTLWASFFSRYFVVCHKLFLLLLEGISSLQSKCSALYAPLPLLNFLPCVVALFCGFIKCCHCHFIVVSIKRYLSSLMTLLCLW